MILRMCEYKSKKACHNIYCDKLVMLMTLRIDNLKKITKSGCINLLVFPRCNCIFETADFTLGRRNTALIPFGGGVQGGKELLCSNTKRLKKSKKILHTSESERKSKQMEVVKRSEKLIKS